MRAVDVRRGELLGCLVRLAASRAADRFAVSRVDAGYLCADRVNRRKVPDRHFMSITSMVFSAVGQEVMDRQKPTK